MAKNEKDIELLEDNVIEEEYEGVEDLTPKQMKKFKKAVAKSEELEKEIESLKEKIDNESDQKAKNKLRKQKDALVEQYYGISESKDGMTIPMSRKTKNIIKSVVAVVVVVALLCTYVFTGTAKYGLLSFFGVPQSTLSAAYVVDGEGEKHPIKATTYNYYYALLYQNLQSQQSTYSQYGLDDDTLASLHLDIDFDEKLSKQTTTNDDGETITYQEYLDDYVLESIRTTYTYYYEAVKANDGKVPEMSDDDAAELDETLESYTESANSYGYTLDGYLKASMGKGVNEKVFRREAKIAYISADYQEEYSDMLASKSYSDDEYEAYKEENYDDLITVDVKIFECSTEDDAKAFAKALKADGSNFAELASQYSTEDWDKQAYKDEAESTYKDINKSTLKNLSYAITTVDEHEHSDDEEEEEHTYSGIEKMFSAKKGDIIQDSTSVVYVIKGSHLPESKPVSVRHILITPETDDEDGDATTATDEQWDDALDTAKSILDEWKDGDATAESFGELAKEYTEDSNGDDGGLYENVTPNQMVSTFNAWCFDSSRKAGDTGIVKTEYGYHIMYFEQASDLTVWEYTAQQALASEDGETEQAELEASYTIRSNWLGKKFCIIDTDIDY